MQKLRKALQERTKTNEMEGLKLSERLEKAKYLKRTGSPGSYKYIYKEAKGKAPSGKFDQKNYKEIYNNFGFSKEQAKKLAQKGIKASRIQKVINTTENIKLQETDNLYRYLVGGMKEIEQHEGHKKYERSIQKKPKRRPSSSEVVNSIVERMGMASSPQFERILKESSPAEQKKVAKLIDLGLDVYQIEGVVVEGGLDDGSIDNMIEDPEGAKDDFEEAEGDPDVGISPREPKPKKKVKPKAPVDLYGYEDQVGAEESAGRLQTKINKLVSSRKIKLSEENLDKLWDDVMGAKGEPSSSDIIKMAKKYSK